MPAAIVNHVNGVAEAFPCAKSAGGKTQLLDVILPKLPAKITGKYVEPFVGGGAVFFALHRAGRLAGKSVIADTNPDLVAMYRAIKTDVEALIRNLQPLRNTPEEFLRIRALDPKDYCDSRRGARFLYLNKTCFNGLWRTNQSGQFNVPWGKYKNPTICDPEKLRAASVALRNTGIYLSDFSTIVDGLGPGDVCYCDPPYFPVSKTAMFVAYGKDGFKDADQARLEECARRVAKGGTRMLLSNADTVAARALYESAPGWRLTRVEAKRAVNRDGDKRGPVGELLIDWKGGGQ